MAAGDPLPAAWKPFNEWRAFFRRGSISTIAGMSGSMKTTLILNYLNLARYPNGSPIPTFYFSSDSDDHVVASRVLSMRTGKPMHETEKWLEGNRPFAASVLRELDYVKWSFNPSPSFDDLFIELDAYAELHGQYPHMVVIDILMDIDTGEGEVTQNYWTTMKDLKILARDIQSAVVILHHTTEAKEGNPVQPKSAMMGKASQLPALMVNLAGEAINGKLHVGIVKNRYGKDDASGGTYFTLRVTPEVCRVEELQEVPVLFHNGIGVKNPIGENS